MEKDITGHRYIERITEVVPTENENDLYKANDIVQFVDGRYVISNKISEESKKEIFRYLTREEQGEYNVIFGI